MTISYEAPPFTPEIKNVPLGEVLHSYLNPANPGVEKNTAEALDRAGLPVHELDQLGLHIHPSILNDEQLANWTSPEDLQEAGLIYRLYEERDVTDGHIPTVINRGANNKRPEGEREPEWSIRARLMLKYKSVDDHPIGPAVAWALIDHGIGIRRSEKRQGRLNIASDTPWDSGRAKNEKGEKSAQIMEILYREGVIAARNVPASKIDDRNNTANWAVPNWAKTTVNRLYRLGENAQQRPLLAGEIPVLRGNSVPLTQRDGKTWIDRAKVKRTGVSDIVSRIKEKDEAGVWADYATRVSALQESAGPSSQPFFVQQAPQQYGQPSQPVFDPKYAYSQLGPSVQPFQGADSYQGAAQSQPSQIVHGTKRGR
ncbi:hypothetical protein [Streptomyces sp. RP5T]|uniref:hypothetical protein n=1 Tax=Streptomyces sp. RP5T TaxID=2490848 RepID=UPI000F6464A8|nr:hypothetical protein [Streptomyces sp. RP5T]